MISPLDRKDHGWVVSVWEQLSVVLWSVFFVCVLVPIRFLDIPFSIVGAALAEQCPHYNMYKFTLLKNYYVRNIFKRFNQQIKTQSPSSEKIRI